MANEDFLYPANYFFVIEAPWNIAQVWGIKYG